MLRINEIFHSIQGESTHSGRTCVFVRLTGCNLRCGWCDSEYAFHEGRSMTIPEVVEAVEGYPCRLVEITGGEPLLQPAVIPLMARLIDLDYEVLLETGGSLAIDRVPAGVQRIIDIKCPGSGEVGRNRWENLSVLRTGDELKFVLADRHDYDWAHQEIRERRLADWPLLFSPVHGRLDAAELARWMIEDDSPARIQLQLHKLLWPGVVRGV